MSSHAKPHSGESSGGNPITRVAKEVMEGFSEIPKTPFGDMPMEVAQSFGEFAPGIKGKGKPSGGGGHHH